MFKFLLASERKDPEPRLRDFTDSLRNYPVLAVFYVAALSASSKVGSYQVIVGYTALLAIAALTLLCLSQTVLLFSLSFHHIARRRVSSIPRLLQPVLTALFAVGMAAVVLVVLELTNEIAAHDLTQWLFRQA